ncbi:hypothetical protein A3765_07985 [Oleiphilus sp. HI0130]|jgi:urease accessory protein|uniref:urease accessory protein UreD n=1 Tax=Oleiphilus sp. HI0079 TaxID=1822254 RepID=UPI0007C28799|nr:urease accessory protein UreD [Oleiphilus sp. HI0079]KZZ54127.1 hypothetical protein A3758_10230 [Oleiphilus sp. HI0118]KZZ63527.1 hypothetical protein A3765_07985 [Oleiphilus sp. HI0130]KZZ74560.1 hypothetical protein A3767_22660 [Oleiphilus sp. HI0133]KZZ10888.1 hypothetical protein A3750_07345 [Oleiphilus sp. HI0079]KZZ77691.1 hypothetical protein A3767_14785 [Oleiphilus sp. HI0133]
MSLVVESKHPEAATYGNNRAWKARLALGYRQRSDKTVLSKMQFEGPLRVQRPFYPEHGRCHTYLLHPPGGMVSGDQIDIDVSVDSNANAFITTPSAGKIYSADSANVVQTQNIQLSVSDGASLEFLPQENILFNGANARLSTTIDVSAKGRLIAWDMVSFGRPYGGYWFDSGSLSQQISISIEGDLVLHEGFRTDPELVILESSVGLMGYKHMGSLFIAVPEEEDLYKTWVELIRQHVSALDIKDTSIGATHRHKLLIVRALSQDVEQLRNTFISIWQHIRPQVLGAEPIMPRIWLT